MRLEQYLKGYNYFWVMHLTYDGDNGPELWRHALKNKVIGLDRSDVNNNWNDFTEAEKKNYYWNSSSLWYNQFQAFCNKMKKDDLVVVLEGQKSILGIGKIKDNRFDFNLDLKTEEVFFDHYRAVSWQKTWGYDEKRPAISSLLRFTNTIQRAPKNGEYWNILSKVDLER